jgi:hypothetical protein
MTDLIAGLVRQTCEIGPATSVAYITPPDRPMVIDTHVSLQSLESFADAPSTITRQPALDVHPQREFRVLKWEE